MIQRLCHRCKSVLHAEDEGTLIYCWNCGAAQVRLSEELQEQAAAQQQSDAAAASLASDGTPETDADKAVRLAAQPPDLLVVWKSVIRIAAVVAIVLSVICIALPLQFLAWMAPSVVLAIYCSRHRETHITTAVGARIGLLCGILSAFGIGIAEVAQLLVLRYGFHKGSEFDATINPALLEAKARAVAQSGQAAADSIFNPLLTVPEFRVGFFLFLIAFGTAILLVLSTASGAFSGFMRSRKQVR